MVTTFCSFVNSEYTNANFLWTDENISVVCESMRRRDGELVDRRCIRACGGRGVNVCCASSSPSACPLSGRPANRCPSGHPPLWVHSLHKCATHDRSIGPNPTSDSDELGTVHPSNPTPRHATSSVYELGNELGLRVVFTSWATSWAYELCLRVVFTSWGNELCLRVGQRVVFTSWVLRLLVGICLYNKCSYKECSYTGPSGAFLSRIYPASLTDHISTNDPVRENWKRKKVIFSQSVTPPPHKEKHY